MRSFCLRARRVVGDVWLVVRRPEQETFDLDAAMHLLNSSQFLLERVFEEADRNSEVSHSQELLTLPDWGSSPTEAQRERARSFRGAYLILVDRDVEDRIGYRALDVLSRLQVRGIAFLSKFRDDTAAEILFNAPPRWGRLPSLLALFARRNATVSNRRLTPSLKPMGFQQDADGRCETRVIERLDASLDEKGEPEQFKRYMLFEGRRQLAPVRNTHDGIARDGDGRYSLWDRKLIFAPTDPKRLFRSLYWLVENNAANRKLLPYYPVGDRERMAADDSVAESAAKLAAILDGHSPQSAQPLRKGDTVVVATHALPPGGAERQWAYLAVGLKRAGYDVKVVVYRKLLGVDAHYAHLLEAEDIPILDPDTFHPEPFALYNVDDSLLWTVFKAKVIDDLPKLWRFSEMLKRLRPKAVYAQLDEPNIYLSLAAMVAGVSHIVPSFRNTNPSTFAYHRAWYRTAYLVIARSMHVKLSGNSRLANQDYADWLGLDADRIACIPNALDDELFPQATRDETDALRNALGLRPDQKVILGVFRFAEEKNPLCFLRTVARVAREFLSLRVFIVGVGRLADLIAREIKAQGLSEVITVLGQRSDVNVLMSLSDLLLLTSSHEGLPNVVLEAQLCGLPVVATDVGGTSEALKCGESGVLCPADDDIALAAACVAILRDRDSAIRMAEAGATFIHEKFGLGIMTERYLALAGGTAATTAPSDGRAVLAGAP